MCVSLAHPAHDVLARELLDVQCQLLLHLGFLARRSHQSAQPSRSSRAKVPCSRSDGFGILRRRVVRLPRLSTTIPRTSTARKETQIGSPLRSTPRRCYRVAAVVDIADCAALPRPALSCLLPSW